MIPAAPFLPRYAAQYLQDADANFTALRHYLDALDMRALAHRMGAIFAGKLPHAATLVPGGITEKITALKISEYRSGLDTLREFIDQCVSAGRGRRGQGVSRIISRWARAAAISCRMACFPFPAGSDAKLLPAGVLLEGKLQPLNAGRHRRRRGPLALFLRFGPAVRTTAKPSRRRTKPVPIPGSRRRVTTARSWKSARWPACWSAVRTARTPRSKTPWTRCSRASDANPAT